MTEPRPARNLYVGPTALDVELDGASYQLVVHLGIVAGRAACVGVDVRAFVQEYDRERDRPGPIRPIDDWQELTPARLRLVRLGEAVQHAVTAQRSLLDEVIDYPGVKWADGEIERLSEHVQALVATEDGPKRAGRPATLRRPEVVDLVVRTYREHLQLKGGSPVVAVRDALEASGLITGADPVDGSVTMDQARAAVRRARSLGRLPEGKRS